MISWKNRKRGQYGDSVPARKLALLLLNRISAGG
nr:MAG TPA_asm: hypothetical protein [Caudoviricetes sp.]